LITKAARGNDSGLSVSRGAAGETALAEHILFQRGALSVVQGGQYHLWPDWKVTYRDTSPFGPVTNTAVLRNNGTGEYLGVNYKGLSFMSSYLAQESPSFVNGIIGDTRVKRGFSDLGYTLQATSRWRMTFNATYSRSLLDAPDFPSVHEDSYESDLEWTNFITLSPSDQLTFGTVYTHIAGRETSLGDRPGAIIAQGSRNSVGTYVQYEHQLTDEVKLIGGVQVNKIGAISANAVPRGGVVWNPFSRIALKCLYGGAYRAPSLAENLLNDPFLHGKRDLNAEKTGTADVQLIYTTPRFQASLDYFRSRLRDLIFVDSSAFPASFTNKREHVDFQGVDTEAKLYLKRDWFLTGSIFYQANDGAAQLQGAFPAPNLVAKAGVSYLSPGGTAVSVFDAYQNNVAGFASTLNAPTEAFHSISVHARYDLSKRWLKDDTFGAALFLNADDLSNAPVWLPALWASSPNTIPVVRGRTVLLGIEFWQKKN
jgi:TonB dependent receptor